ncbi:hypothetical protein FBU59_005466 [Linderina macrospora]|uniref:Uncharacterized protein n=1 Tax=Linderina macrospora TaxID=4868 RepID=A0ACC1J2K7_9FUNG|nr:hypothetical protein FBU59_005466 [Linderina macrospora]
MNSLSHRLAGLRAIHGLRATTATPEVASLSSLSGRRYQSSFSSSSAEAAQEEAVQQPPAQPAASEYAQQLKSRTRSGIPARMLILGAPVSCLFFPRLFDPM